MPRRFLIDILQKIIPQYLLIIIAKVGILRITENDCTTRTLLPEAYFPLTLSARVNLGIRCFDAACRIVIWAFFTDAMVFTSTS